MVTSSQRVRRSTSSSIPFRALRCGTVLTKAKVHAANRLGEFAACFAAQVLCCIIARRGRCWREFQNVIGSNDAHRGAGCFCQLRDADQIRPIGVLTNLASLGSQLPMGWPIFHEAHFAGPLPRKCACTAQRKTLRGTLRGGGFNSWTPSRVGVMCGVTRGRSLCMFCVFLVVRTLWEVLRHL